MLYNDSVTIIKTIDMKFNVTDFYGLYVKFSVNLVRRFRVLHNIPKCWVEVANCTTQHGTYESGNTTIYQSQTTKKYYMVRYFDGCFNQMYTEINGVDWCRLKSELDDFWKSKRVINNEMWSLCENGEMTYREKNVRYSRMKEEAKDILLRMVA